MIKIIKEKYNSKNYCETHRNNDILDCECHNCKSHIQYDINGLSHSTKLIHRYSKSWLYKLESIFERYFLDFVIPFNFKNILIKYCRYIRNKITCKNIPIYTLDIKCPECDYNNQFFNMGVYKIHRNYYFSHEKEINNNLNKLSKIK